MTPSPHQDAFDREARQLPLDQARLVRLLVDELPRLADSPAPLLIEGEPGCGRAALATIVHGLVAPRSRQPLRRIRCAGSRALERLQRALVVVDRERSDRGSLLLEEVGGMTLPVQQCLLAWLEDRADRPTPRLLSTATGLVQERLERGEFRRDLYHRLAVLHLRLPAMAEADDVDARMAPSAAGAPALDAGRVRQALAASNGNLSQAARRLHVHRSTLWRAMKRWQITR